jgi:hypothetical protein
MKYFDEFSGLLLKPNIDPVVVTTFKIFHNYIFKFIKLLILKICL